MIASSGSRRNSKSPASAASASPLRPVLSTCDSPARLAGAPGASRRASAKPSSSPFRLAGSRSWRDSSRTSLATSQSSSSDGWDAGAGTLVDLNLARAAEGRAERKVELAIAAAIAARAKVAERIGLSPAELPKLEGDLPESWPSAAPVEDLEARALDQRQDLVGLKIEIETAAARLRLEQSLAAPNLVLGVATGREADREDLTTVLAGVTIPLFARNQGGVAAARVLSRRRARRPSWRWPPSPFAPRWRQRPAATRPRRAHSRSSARLSPGTLDENLALVQKAFASGKLRASEVLAFRREFDSRRELIEATADAWLAKIALDLATGDTQIPAPVPNSPSSTPPETSLMTRLVRTAASTCLAILGLSLGACDRAAVPNAETTVKESPSGDAKRIIHLAPEA